MGDETGMAGETGRPVATPWSAASNEDPHGEAAVVKHGKILVKYWSNTGQ